MVNTSCTHEMESIFLQTKMAEKSDRVSLLSLSVPQGGTAGVCG